MSMDKMIPLMLGGIKDTLYMTTVSTLFAYLLGLPLAILLVLTAPFAPWLAPHDPKSWSTACSIRWSTSSVPSRS